MRATSLPTLLLALGLAGPALAQDKGTLAPRVLPPLAHPEDPATPARELFGRWDIVLAYDVGKGLRPLAGPDANRLRTMVQWLTERMGNAANWPRDPDQAIAAIDALLERNLIDPPEQRKRIAVVLDYDDALLESADA